MDSTDVVSQTELVTAFLSLARWPNNPVDVLIIPNQHFENIYDVPALYAIPIHTMNQAVALALKAVYRCDGISLRQHNEPAGNQDVWHFHVHITPRFTTDNFYTSSRVAFPDDQRLSEAGRIREYIRGHSTELYDG